MSVLPVVILIFCRALKFGPKWFQQSSVRSQAFLFSFFFLNSAFAMTDFGKRLHRDVVSQLHDLAAAGDAARLKALLGHSPSLVNAAAGNGWTALMYGARNGHLQVVEVLLQAG